MWEGGDMEGCRRRRLLVDTEGPFVSGVCVGGWGGGGGGYACLASHAGVSSLTGGRRRGMFVDRYSTILTTSQWTARWFQGLKRKDGERNVCTALNTCCGDSVHTFKALC